MWHKGKFWHACQATRTLRRCPPLHHIQLRSGGELCIPLRGPPPRRRRRLRRRLRQMPRVERGQKPTGALAIEEHAPPRAHRTPAGECLPQGDAAQMPCSTSSRGCAILNTANSGQNRRTQLRAARSQSRTSNKRRRPLRGYRIRSRAELRVSASHAVNQMALAAARRTPWITRTTSPSSQEARGELCIPRCADGSWGFVDQSPRRLLPDAVRCPFST